MQVEPTTSPSKAGQLTEEDRARLRSLTTRASPSRSSTLTWVAVLSALAKTSNSHFQRTSQPELPCSPGFGTTRLAIARSTWTVLQSPSIRPVETHPPQPSNTQIAPICLLPTLTMAALQSRAKKCNTPTLDLVPMSLSRTLWPMTLDPTPELALL